MKSHFEAFWVPCDNSFEGKNILKNTFLEWHLKWGGRWGAAHALLLLLVTETQCCLQGVWRHSLIPASVTSLHICGSCSSSRNLSGHMRISHWGRGGPYSHPYLVEDTLFSLPCFSVHTFWMAGVERDRVRHRAAEPEPPGVPQGPLIQTQAGRPAPAHGPPSPAGFLLALWVISPSLKVLGLGDPQLFLPAPGVSWEDDGATESCILFPSSGFHFYIHKIIEGNETTRVGKLFLVRFCAFFGLGILHRRYKHRSSWTSESEFPKQSVWVKQSIGFWLCHFGGPVESLPPPSPPPPHHGSASPFGK